MVEENQLIDRKLWCSLARDDHDTPGSKNELQQVYPYVLWPRTTKKRTNSSGKNPHIKFTKHHGPLLRIVQLPKRKKKGHELSRDISLRGMKKKHSYPIVPLQPYSFHWLRQTTSSKRDRVRPQSQFLAHLVSRHERPIDDDVLLL